MRSFGGWGTGRFLLFVLCVSIGIATIAVMRQSAYAQTITVPKPGEPVSLRVHDTDLRVEGCVAPNSLVTIVDDGTVVGTTTSAAHGLYQHELTAQTPTIHAIETYFEDAANRRSSATKDLIALPPKQLTTLVAHPPPTVEHAPGVVEIGKNITFRGYGCPHRTVTVTVDGSTDIVALTNATGYWTVTINSINFLTGVHTYTVSASGTGYESDVSQKFQFSVADTTQTNQSPQPSNQNSDVVDISEPVIIIEPKDGYRSTTKDIIVSGTGPANAQIEIYIDGLLVGSVFTNPFGEWSLILNDLKQQQSITARACNVLRCGDFSDAITVYLGDEGMPGNCTTELELKKYRFNSLVVGKGIDLHMQIEGVSDRYVVRTDWGDTVIDHQTLENDQLITHHTYSNTGHYNGTVSIHQEDNIACKDIVYFSVRVVEQSPSNRWLFVMIIFIPIALLYFIRRILYQRHTRN